MLKNLSREVKATQALGYVSSTGATTQYGAKIDTAGFSGCRHVLSFGTTAGSTGTATFTVVGTNTSTAASTSYATINGASVAIAAVTAGTLGKFASIDLWLLKYRYLKAKITRTGKVRINSVMADAYGAQYVPTLPSSTTISSTSLGNVLCVAST
jgi:hypothetical protein